MAENKKQKVENLEPKAEYTDSLVENLSWRHYSFFVIRFIQSILFAIAYPPMRQYLYAKIANKYIMNTTYAINSTFNRGGNSLCWSKDASLDRDNTQQKVQSETAMWNLYFNLAVGIPQILMWFYLGYLTDIIGRKPVIILNIFGYIIRLFIYAVVIYWDLATVYLLIACIFDGISGSFAGYSQLTLIYTADVTKKGKQRGFFLTVVYSLTDIIYGIVNMLSGYIIKAYGFFWPIFITAIVMFILNVNQYFLVAETLEQNSEPKKLSLTKSIKSVLSFYWHKTEEDDGRTRFKFWFCLISYAMLMQGIIGKWDVSPLYAMNSPFCWTSVELGQFTGVVLLIQPAVTIVALYFLQRIFTHEVIAVLGFLSLITENLVFAFSSKSWMLYISAILGAPGPLTFSMIRTIVSHLTAPKEQGSVFAGLGTVESLCGMTSSVMLNSVYAHTLSWMKGFVFIVSALFYIIPIILLLILHFVNKREKVQETFELPVKKNTEDTTPEVQPIEYINKSFIAEENK